MNKTSLALIILCAYLPSRAMQSGESQAHNHNGVLLNQALPYIFNCISPFYRNLKVFTDDDQNTIRELHTWYCQMVLYQKECTHPDSCTLPSDDYEVVMAQIGYLESQYNAFPSKQKEVDAIHVTESLNDYLGERIARLTKHKKLFGPHVAQALQEFHTWYHVFQKFHEDRENDEMAMSKQLFDEVEEGLGYLELQANLPHMAKPRLGIHRLPRWYVFQSRPKVNVSK